MYSTIVFLASGKDDFAENPRITCGLWLWGLEFWNMQITSI